MWFSVGLTLLVGACLGLVVDRLLFRPAVTLATPAPASGPLWFVCDEGSLAGALPGGLEGERKPDLYEGFRARLVERLSKELSLSATQQGELETMLEEKRPVARKFWQDLRRSYCDLHAAFRGDIRALLDPEQEKVFDRLTAELDRRALEQVREHAASRP